MNYKKTDSVVVNFNKNASYQSMYEPVPYMPEFVRLKEVQEVQEVRKLNDVSPEEWDTAFRNYYNAK
jgi:hypothetical protein